MKKEAKIENVEKKLASNRRSKTTLKRVPSIPQNMQNTPPEKVEEKRNLHMRELRYVPQASAQTQTEEQERETVNIQEN